MADKEIVSLPESGAVTDDTLFVVYQPGAAEPAQKLTAEQLSRYKRVGKKGTATGAEIFNDYENNKATGEYSHAEGIYTKSSGGLGSHAEGNSTNATGGYGSHAEGQLTVASGNNGSHAEGFSTKASGNAGSHAEGDHTIASGNNGSHAEGYFTTAKGKSQHAQGKWNIVDEEEKYAHIVGNGESDNARSNAHTVDWEGNAWFAGDVYTGGASQDDPEAQKLATVAEVGEMIGQMPGGDVSAESIKTALGYTPADAEDVRQLSEDIGDIDTALDAILAIQNSYIGGEGA